MNKIKVSKEVGKALDLALKRVSKQTLMNDHASKFQWSLEIYLPLNQISNWEMAQILINGYEVEETPEEKLIYFYNEKTKSEYGMGVNDGVLSTLNILGIKIKGIND